MRRIVHEELNDIEPGCISVIVGGLVNIFHIVHDRFYVFITVIEEENQ